MSPLPYSSIAFRACCWISLLLLSSAAERAAATETRSNVIFITIDTLRADHLGCYGYARIQTPNIDQLARSGARFTRAFTPVPITLPAHAAIFTGSYPMATGMHDFSGNKLSPAALTLAKVLRENGYGTAAFVGSAVLDSRFGLNQGFETYFDHFDFSRLDETSLDLMERRGDLVMDEALGWLKLDPHQPFLLWVHLYDPHFPYTPPEPYASRYRAHLYDGEIAFDDTQVGRLLSFLKQRGAFENSIIVLAGDHGEGLGEHGEKTHGFFIYDSTLHVPLIIKIPGAAPRLVDEDVSLIDVLPTLLQALKISVPAGVQGRSRLGLVLGRPGQRASASSELYAETYLPLLHFRWSQLRALKLENLKYIDAPRAELYDTRSDPRELTNLYATRQSTAHELRDRLNGLIGRLTPGRANSGGSKELTDPALLERLRSLGYVAVSAGTFQDSTGRTLPDPKDRIEVYEMVSEAMSDGQHGRYEDSLRKLREAENAEPASLPIRYLTALDFYRMKNYSQALERFRAALELDPKFALGTYYLGLTQVQLGDLDSAASSFERALELDPTNFSAAYNLGAAYLKKKRIEDALRLFERATKINPDYAPAHEALGELYLHLKRFDDAIPELERAVVLAPGIRKAHRDLGEAYAAKGLGVKAEQEFRKAKALSKP